MNIRFLVCSSFLIALLFHVAFINLTTFVFPIDPESPKPKFFFLGPILTQKEVKFISSQEQVNDFRATTKEIVSADSAFYNQITDGAASDKNPFSISTINKPLTAQTENTQEKVILKSTFTTDPITDKNEKESAEPKPDLKLNIQPYRPLQFRTPTSVNIE